MNTRYCAGPHYNHLSRATSWNASSEMEEDSVPLLWDEKPVEAFRFGGEDTEHYVTADLQYVRNGEFEDEFAEDLTPGEGWTLSGGATAVRDEDEEHAGTACLVLHGAADNADYAEYRVKVRPGERLQISGALKKVTEAGAPAAVEVFLEEAELWLDADGDWQDTPAQPFTNDQDVYALFQETMAIPPMDEVVGATELTLVIRLYAGETGTAENAYDSIVLIPETDFVSVHGHDIDARCAVTLEHDSDPDFGTSVTIPLTPLQPTFYEIFDAPVFSRHWRFQLTTTRDSGPYGLGELVLGRTLILSRDPDHPERTEHPVSHLRAQVRHSSGAGDVHVYSMGQERRKVTLPYDGTGPEIAELLLELHRRTANGESTLVLIPRDDRVEVILGRLTNAYDTARMLEDRLETEVVVEEAALPQLSE